MIGISVRPAATGRVAGDLLEEDRDEERRRAEAAVDEQGRDVADREVARAEDRERQHRVVRAALVEDEGDEQRDADQPGQVDDRIAEAVDVGCSISANTGPARPSATSSAPR